MTNNTKQRSEEIQQAAADLLAEMNVDVTERVEIRPMAKILAERINCHYTTAKTHVGRAVRRARGELVSEQWGGPREGSGYPKGQKRNEQEKPVTNQELADTIKRLSTMQTWEREEVEDRIGSLGPSGLLAYADDPVNEAIGVFEEIKTGWELARKYPQSYRRAEAEITAGIADAEDMIARLKS